MGFIMNAKQLFKQLDECLNECFLWPNDILPEEFRDNRSEHVSQRDIVNKLDGLSQSTHTGSADEEEAAERAIRVQAYSAMVAQEKEIEYITR